LSLENRELLIKEIDLAEFNQLRLEINNRTDISTKLVLGQITVLGIGVSLAGAGETVASKLPAIFPGICAVSSILWLLSMSHVHQIYKLGGYIACKLAPRLRCLAGAWLLGWEEYSRLMDRDDPERYKLSHSKIYIPIESKFPTGRNIARFTPGVYAAVTPFLMALDVFIIISKTHHIEPCWLTVLQVIGLAPALLLWIYGMRQFFLIKHIKENIDAAVIKVATGRDSLADESE
jgi:hypothetical protein